MADRVLVSPGVFDREIDGTIRPNTPVGIGAAVISTRAKGPAFEPVVVKDLDEDQLVFGPPAFNGKDLGAYTARAYLRTKTNPLTQIRILGMSDTGVTPGYSVGGTYAIVASGSNVVALIQSSGAVTLPGTLTSSVDKLGLNIAGYGSVTASLQRNDVNYIGKILNTDPSQYSTQKHILFAVYDYTKLTPAANGNYVISQVPLASSFTDDFITGSTPVVISQPFGATEWNLFGIGSIFAGDTANYQVKISFLNIKKSPSPDQNPYGTFTLVVRQYDDNDNAPVVLESFSNLNLNPNDKNYIAKRIGDMYRVWNKSTKKFDEFGEYERKSKYIYIIPSLDLKNQNVPEASLPYGFSGYQTFPSATFGGFGAMPDVPVVQNFLYKGDFSTKVYLGTAPINNASGAINYGVTDRLKHLPKALRTASGSSGTSFSLKYLSGVVANVSGYSNTTRLSDANISSLSTSLSYSVTTTVLTGTSGGYLTLDNIENTPLAKFTMLIQDGFDALDITKANPLDPSDMSSTTAYQTYACRTAIDMLSNPDEIELTELVIPGVWAQKVTDYVISMVENRGDMFYITDLTGTSVSDVISDVSTKQMTTNYAAGYYPSLKLRDEFNDKQVDIPPSVIMPAVYAYSDSVSFPWFSPAGMTRGGLDRHGVSRAKEKLNKTDRDNLYENRINPIMSTTKDGPVVWGQKTFYILESALNRINVRRMLLRVRKLIAKKALQIVFEPNVPAVWDSFIRSVQPDLERIQKNFGIDDFRLILDDSTTTEDLIERNIMYGKIAIRPTRAAEMILLDFFITNNVAGFAE